MKKSKKFRTFAGILAWIIALGTIPPVVSGAEEIENEIGIYEEAEYNWDEPVEPEETEPEVTEPEETEVEVIEPEETEAEVTEPEETEPEVIEPEETEPEVIEPEETEPEVIEPEETEPEEPAPEEEIPEEELQPEEIPEIPLYEQLLLCETLTELYELLTAEENAETLALLTEEEITELLAKTDDLYNTVFIFDPMNAELALSAEIVGKLNALPNAPVVETEELPEQEIPTEEAPAEEAPAEEELPVEEEILTEEPAEPETPAEEIPEESEEIPVEEPAETPEQTLEVYGLVKVSGRIPEGVELTAEMLDETEPAEPAEEPVWDIVDDESIEDIVIDEEILYDDEIIFFDDIIVEAPVFWSSGEEADEPAEETETEYAFAIDITLYDELGEVWQPDEPVEVTLDAYALGLNDGQQIRVVHQHTPEEEPVELDVYTVENGTLTFTTDGFSVFYGYVVNFLYGEKEYTLESGTTIFLSELFEALEIDLTLGAVDNVVCTNPGQIEVTQVDGDWKLEVVQEMSADETLTVILKDGTLTESEASAGNEETVEVLMLTQMDGMMLYFGTKADELKFTVQYYAELNRIIPADTARDNTLPIIDTSAANNDGKPTLPKNGATLKFKNLRLQEAGSGRYQIYTEPELVEIYSAGTYNYNTAPSLHYFNRLSANSNYTLNAILVAPDSSAAEAGEWDEYGTDISFTNNAASADETKVLIADGTVIRLIYDATTEDSYTTPVTFYDYNITDGKYYTDPTKTSPTDTYTESDLIYVNTANFGINSDGNYSGDGTKLAFGNDNTGTKYQDLSWNDNNTLNKYNVVNADKSVAEALELDHWNNGGGCTFGITSGLKNGKIVYSDGISAPKLFNEEGSNVEGSKWEVNGYSLQFERVGDTYTLSSVNDNEGNVVETAENLKYFNNPNKHPKLDDTKESYTNNFWPMDAFASEKGRDVIFGSYYHAGYDDDGVRNVYKEKYLRKYEAGAWKILPISDDGLDHNSYFGMHYEIKFNLSEDYVGPLEYYFFGDDDMWVFLDGQLVCDIGGVHSAVGEYVDLWDYMYDEDGKKSGEHTLSFFYTERGASGSTCYMRFTLPSVSYDIPGLETGVLRIEKDVQSPLGIDRLFDFSLEFSSTYSDDYACPFVIYTADGEVVSDGTITERIDFKLSDGQYILIRSIPDGTSYTVTETTVDGYTTTVGANRDGQESRSTMSDSISANNITNVLFINKHNVVIDTAVTLDILPYIILFSIVGTGVILASADHRRKADEVDD